MDRYEAIRRIKAWNLDSDDLEVLGVLIPELAESEDERIRKELLAVINDLVLPDEQMARFNAYLEKQKEQKPATPRTIQDARPGDILNSARVQATIIFKGFNPDGKHIDAYCALQKGIFIAQEMLWDRDFEPATQVWKDAIFDAMVRKGYLWDAENKRLNKAVQQPAECNEDERIMEAIEGTIRVYGKTQGAYLAGYDMDTLVVHLRNAFAALEKQKESLHIPETCKENADSFTDEDEKIRKEIIHYIINYKADNVSEEQEHAWLEWLEKKKEQKPTPDWMPKFLDELRSKKNYFDWDEHRDIEGEILAIINWIAPNYFEQKEQKPNYCHYGGDPSIERCKYCSATCSARLTEEQKPAEWSEEELDKAAEEYVWTSIDSNDPILVPKYIPLLLSLFKGGYAYATSHRPHWKPSEEQMKALLNAEGYLRAGLQHDSAKTIAELYEQLKQL